MKPKEVFDNIKDALEYCIQNYSEPNFIFRGQRKNWLLCASLFRIPDEKDREKKWKDTLKFCNWMLNNPLLSPYHKPEEKLIAIAQHYGYATDLIDFTRDPKVAAFFASSVSVDPYESGVIIVADLNQYNRLCGYYKMPQLPPLEINGLWRLENQKGIFLHDYYGIFTQWENFGYLDLMVDKVFFKHSPGRSELHVYPDISEKKIYPEPNDLEREIERFENIRLRSRPINLEHFVVHPIKRDLNDIDTEQKLLSLSWESNNVKKWAEISQRKFSEYPEIDSNESIELIFNTISPSTIESTDITQNINAVKKFREFSLTKKKIPDINVVIRKGIISENDNKKMNNILLCSKLQEILVVSIDLPYTEEQIAKSLQTLFAFYVSSSIHELSRSYMDAISRHVFGSGTIFLEYEDMAGIVSKCNAPEIFFDKSKHMTELRLKCNKLRGYNLSGNYQIFQFITDIKKIMTFEEAIELWASIIVPSDIFFRHRSSRILNPYYVKVLGFA